MKNFSITTHDLFWIGKTADDPRDLCLHGYVTVTIGSATLAHTSDITVSAAALYLLKTLTDDHRPEDGGLQLLPCCGHMLIPNNDLTAVDICGCPNGVDWAVRHEGGCVRLILEDGRETLVPFEEYQAEVFRFADRIEAFYNACSPKHLPSDRFGQDGYTTFWKEWHLRRGNK